MVKEESHASAVDLESLRSDRRQLGGMLLVMGACVTFESLAGISANQDVIIRAFDMIWRICGGIIQISAGTLAMIVGYLSLVHDHGGRRLTGTLLLLTQLSWVPFVIGIIQIGIVSSPPYVIETRTSSSDSIALLEYVVNPFVPENYLPKENDVRFLGIMGMLGLVSYGIGFFGSLVFLEASLYALDAGKPIYRDAKYYQGRLLFYSFDFLIAGMSQILFGAYALFEFGRGPLYPPIRVAMYTVSFPEIAIAVGSIQMIVGYCGVGNYLQLFPVGPGDNQFQILLLTCWLLQFVLQYFVQHSYNEYIESTVVMPSTVLYSFGMYILPPFLDYKMRTTTILFNDNCYGIIHRDNKMEANIHAELASSEILTRTLNHEKLDSLEKNDRSEDGSESNLKNVVDSAIGRRKGLASYSNILKSNIQAKIMPKQISKEGLFLAPFSSLQAQIFDRENQIEKTQTREKGRNKTANHISNQELKKISNESEFIVKDMTQNCDKQKMVSEEAMKNRNDIEDIYNFSSDYSNGLGTDLEKSIYRSEGIISISEEIVECHNDSGMFIEKKMDRCDNTGALTNATMEHCLESGITVEEYVDYLDDVSGGNVDYLDDVSGEILFEQKIIEEVGDDNDSQGTPPRSNESFSSDMEGTRGNQSQNLLSLIKGEAFHRVHMNQKYYTRQKVCYPHFHSEDRVQDGGNSPSKESVDHIISDSCYDYGTDEGFEISEATPDDDTAALDAKIDKLKEELISDTHLESYLNEIM